MSDKPPLRALRAFAIAARCTRVADAAAELRVTPSAVSQQIRALEGWIGAPLFDRRTRKARLTDCGRTLLEGVTAPLAAIDAACHAAKRTHDDASLVVSAPTAYVSFRLVPALAAFWRRRPDTRVDIRMASRFDAPVEGGQADIAIRFLHSHPEATQLGAAGWRAVCQRAYFERLGAPRTLAELRQGVLLHEEVFNFWPRAFEQASAPIPSEVRFRGLGDAGHVLAAVLAGEAIALLPRELTLGLTREGALVSPFPVSVEPDAAYFAFSDAASPKPAAKALVDFLQSEI